MFTKQSLLYLHHLYISKMLCIINVHITTKSSISNKQSFRSKYYKDFITNEKWIFRKNEILQNMYMISIDFIIVFYFNYSKFD